jgi:hypothetical protein
MSVRAYGTLPQHPCRPNSARLPTQIGTSAEPIDIVQSFVLFFILPPSAHGEPLVALWLCPKDATRSSSDFSALIPAHSGMRLPTHPGG